MKKELIMVGPPASGKGTQTKKLAEISGLKHVDTGSMLREAVAAETEAGKIAKGYMDKGQLVPVEIVARIIKERLAKDDCKNGFILDGFPRSLEQAEILDSILAEIDKDGDADLKVVYFEIPVDNLIERIVYRRSCPDCGAIYNVKTMTLKKEGCCDKCGAKLVQRADDNEETAKSRFNTYFEQTAPLIDLYDKRGKLVRINAAGTIDEVFENLKAVIK
ncbi:MAG: adenylate kinase [Candidatus Gastranaerophilales bacterium]|nr:adenylate kinase [Candidatus Gastranaerophilales bacterium]